MSRRRKSPKPKPRILVDFEDTRHGSIVVKRLVRNAEGLVVVDNQPRHEGGDSSSESSSPEPMVVAKAMILFGITCLGSMKISRLSMVTHFVMSGEKAGIAEAQRAL